MCGATSLFCGIEGAERTDGIDVVDGKAETTTLAEQRFAVVLVKGGQQDNLWFEREVGEVALEAVAEQEEVTRRYGVGDHGAPGDAVADDIESGSGSFLNVDEVFAAVEVDGHAVSLLHDKAVAGFARG